MIRGPFLTTVLSAAIAAALTGCGSSSPPSSSTSATPSSPRIATSLVVSFLPDDVNPVNTSKVRCLIGKVLLLKATESFSDGSSSDVTTSAGWEFTPAASATVSSGTLTCVQVGSITVNASTQECSTSCAKTGLTGITAASAFPVSLAIQTPAPSLGVGTTMQLTALETQLTAQGTSKVDATNSVSWSSSVPNIGAINPTSGVLTGIATGFVNVTASFDVAYGVPPASVTVSVAPAPLITITGISQGQVVRPGSSITVGLVIPAGYTSPNLINPVSNGATIQSNPLSATIQIPTNFIGPLFLLPIAVDANARTVTGSDITVDVQPEVFPTFAVSPSAISFKYIGEQVYVSLKPVDSKYNPTSLYLSGKIQFTSSSPAIAKIDQEGLVTGVAVGKANIVVTAGVQTVQIPVSVASPSLRGDLDSNGILNYNDYALLDQYNSLPATTPGDARDLNQDGQIDDSDLLVLKGLCGNACN